MTRLSQSPDAMKDSYEAVVIGSGYGASIAAARLAQMGIEVCVLERGKEFALGDFPNSMADGVKALQADSEKGHIGVKDALFDLRVNEDMNILVGCGLGGTTLINGNIMLEPEPRVYEDTVWPEALRAERDTVLADGYAKAREMLNPARYPAHPSLAKIDAFKTSAKALGAEMTYPPQTVVFEGQAGINAAGVFQPACTRCGDCCSGCNVGAKTTTAMTYLPAAVKAGAAIFTNAKVHHIEAAESGWRVKYKAGEDEDMRNVTARYVFCGAGTLGSTEIMLRSAAAGLQLSPQLGTHFSGNGDVLAFSYNNQVPINGIGIGHPAMKGKPPVGPVIAGLIDLRRDDAPLDHNMIIQEGAMPSLLAKILPLTFASAAPIFGKDMTKGDWWKECGRTLKSIFFGSYSGAVKNTQTYLVMAHDGAGGKMELEDDRVRIDWPDIGKRPVYKRISEVLTRATKATGGTYIANPIWHKSLGRNLISVHPLGGCSMADTMATGTVDHKGRAFNGAGGIHPGLYVLDASVIPRSLGVNPGLTISALTERAMIHFERDYKSQMASDIA